MSKKIKCGFDTIELIQLALESGGFGPFGAYGAVEISPHVLESVKIGQRPCKGDAFQDLFLVCGGDACQYFGVAHHIGMTVEARDDVGTARSAGEED